MKKLIALFLCVIVSFTSIAQKPLYSYSKPLTASLTDSLIYLTKPGAIRVLQNNTRLYYSDRVSKQKDSVINLLNQFLLIKDIKVLSLQSQVTDQATQIKAQKKQIFWRGVEIWGYRVGIAGGVALLLLR